MDSEVFALLNTIVDVVSEMGQLNLSSNGQPSSRSSSVPLISDSNPEFDNKILQKQKRIQEKVDVLETWVISLKLQHRTPVEILQLIAEFALPRGKCV